MGNFKGLIFIFCLLALCSCMRWEYNEVNEEFDFHTPGLFILSEGNFQYGNASLGFYNPEDNEVENNVFYRANGMKLGDVAQSMSIHNGKGWIVVNNSHVIFAIDPDTFRETGRIENLTSPRYIHFVNDNKAYVSQLWDNRIFIVNPAKYEVTGYIEVPGMEAGYGSTEQMVQKGSYVYCSCWSYQNRIIKIDVESDRVVGSIEVGIQPRWLALDRLGRLWVLTDGGFEGSPYGSEPPVLCCLDPDSLSILRIFRFMPGENPSCLVTNGEGNKLYWINGGVWCMDIEAPSLPLSPVVESRFTKYYGLTISPENGDIYVGDAIDYQQKGIIYRYDSSGVMKAEFETGISPGAFCWKEK